MFDGVLSLCEKYVSLGWENRSRQSCKEKVEDHSKKGTEELKRLGYTFCKTDDLRITIFYPLHHVREKYPWSLQVTFLARQLFSMMSSFSEADYVSQYDKEIPIK